MPKQRAVSTRAALVFFLQARQQLARFANQDLAWRRRPQYFSFQPGRDLWPAQVKCALSPFLVQEALDPAEREQQQTDSAAQTIRSAQHLEHHEPAIEFAPFRAVLRWYLAIPLRSEAASQREQFLFAARLGLPWSEINQS